MPVTTVTTIERGKFKRISIGPGEYHVTNQRVIISTLLGSCVAACLYDPVRGVVGMNHFLLSNRRYAQNMALCITEAGRYGVHAMELVINEMIKMGAKRENIRAKAFGGGSVLQTSGEKDNFFCVGEVNNRFIIEFLRNEGIPLTASDMGGDRGRVIHFVSEHNYPVYVRKIKKIFNLKLVDREKRFWQESIENQEQKVQEPDIWL